MAQVTKDTFKEFWNLCKKLIIEPSYKAKTSIIKDFIADKSDKKGKYTGNLYLLAKFLLPGTQKRVYNVKEKQLLKYFSQIFSTNLKEMIEHLEDNGVVSDTIMVFFQNGSNLPPKKKSTVTMEEIDEHLEELSAETKEDAQISVLRKISKKCAPDDLCYVIRLIKHDLRTNCGPKHFFEALDENAYPLFQASSDIKHVIDKWSASTTSKTIPGLKKTLSIKATLMTPVKPMLADACKSIEQAFKKCPNGIYSEIKYDGERVQIHKDGDKFQYFSRSLKPVQPHKIDQIKDFIPQACPEGDSLILDGEVLLMDTETSKPLPFGTLGIHKKAKFKDATVCYVIFDILQFNNDNLMGRPIHERRKILKNNIKEIPHRIVHSEMKKIQKKEELESMLKKCFAENLEGLVLKDINSKYEPGKRHWLKIKKDYLQDGAMADTADLVVLGAYIGTGNKGGLMSVFLMGCYDESKQIWVTVAKCGNGHDDDTLQKLQTELDMQKISKNFSKVPVWLDVNRNLVPDYVISDPKKSQVWEITGAEFSQSSAHTADGISIRFPRVTKIRSDKDWKTATNLQQLKKLFEESKKTTDVGGVAMETGEEDQQLCSSTTSKKITKGTTQSTVNDKASPSKPNKKRKKKENEDIDTGSPKKQQKLNFTKTEKKKQPCPYGDKCYRKNPEHLNEYSHVKKAKLSTADEENKTKIGESPDKKNQTKELFNIFTNMCFVLDEGMTDHKRLKRNIIAYDGDVINELSDGDATYMITEEKIDNVNENVIQVKPDWIWSCIKKKRLVALKKELYTF